MGVQRLTRALDDANAALKADHDDMKARFDARESREDDVAQIRGLRREVGAPSVCGKLRSETKQLSLELDNRNQNDLVFGSSGGRPVSGATDEESSRTDRLRDWEKAGDEGRAAHTEQASAEVKGGHARRPEIEWGARDRLASQRYAAPRVRAAAEG